jgi:hypothetical protein
MALTGISNKESEETFEDRTTLTVFLIAASVFSTYVRQSPHF